MQHTGRVLNKDIIADFVYGLAPSTKNQYLKRLTKFLNYLKLKPSASLEERAAFFLKEARRKGKDRGKEWTQKCLMGFITDLEEEVKSGKFQRSTIKNYYKAVRLFYKNNGYRDLDWDRIRRPFKRVRKVADDRAPKLHEIQRLVEYPDRRIKPIVYVMASSGIRVGSWKYSQWKHITPLDKDGQIVTDDREVAPAKMLAYNEKTQEWYTTFITPEAYNALKDWMDFRAANGEEIEPESPLMRDIFAYRYGKKTAENPQKLTSDSIGRIIEQGLKEQGIRTPLTNGAKHYEFQAAHGFRKFFKTAPEQAGMHGINVETLMGHGLGISDHYARPTDLDLLKDYLKTVDSLTISNTKQMVIKEVSENQQALAAQMQSKDREIQALREQTQEMNKQLTAVIEQQQQDANTFDMKFVKLLEIVNSLDQKEILKMMPRKLTTKERQKTEEFMKEIRTLPDE